MDTITHSLVLGRRAIRESLRTPDSLVPSIFIPLFFTLTATRRKPRDVEEHAAAAPGEKP